MVVIDDCKNLSYRTSVCTMQDGLHLKTRSAIPISRIKSLNTRDFVLKSIQQGIGSTRFLQQ